MDRQDARLKQALEEAAPDVEDTGVMGSVMQKGRALRRRRRIRRTVASVAVAVVIVCAGAATFALLARGEGDRGQVGATSESVAVTSTGQPSTSLPAGGATGQDTTTSERATTTSAYSGSTTSEAANTTPPPPRTGTTTRTTDPAGVTHAIFKDVDHGFTVTLPASWHGFTVETIAWEGFRNDTNSTGSSQSIKGTELLIQNPASTSAHPYQDIPIMIFTLSQWDLVQQAKLTVGAAPIPPTELGRNSTYVFALPARYNYAFPAGYKQVETIIAGHPLKGFDPGSSDYDITKADIGKTVAFTVTSRFSVILDGATYPAASTRAIPKGIVGSVSNVPSVTPPLQAARFQALKAGTCTISNGDFQVVVVVVDQTP